MAQAVKKTGANAPAREEKRVEINIPLLENRTDDVVEVGVNGTMTLIRRGRNVSVPASVEEVLRNSSVYYNRV